ncbi:MAG: phosphoribosylaminoimidazolesuccinocarboxamide synthase [Phycisphaerae bacterium]|nr:phosphoribosylaminoimidazolesuccinocarboxamide synthase [Phycisphaerae bacterium]
MIQAKEAVMRTDLPLANRRSGKVRDIYDLSLPDGTEALLIVATDRISAFDVIMENGIPGKGIVLTQISRFWFDRFAGEINHHLLSTDADDIPGLSPDQRAPLQGRIMICRKTNVVPIECVVRGYLAGSGFKDYRRSGAVCGIELPAGLDNGDRLEQPVFTPATKAEEGHDENISFEQAGAQVGEDLMACLRDLSIDLYQRGREYAAGQGIIIADTKFEFGIPVDDPSSGPILIDEVLTPDSSRFWPADRYTPGQEQDSYDKQYVRNFLEELVTDGRWDKTPPGPQLPDTVVVNTLAKYREAFERLTGSPIDI